MANKGNRMKSPARQAKRSRKKLIVKIGELTRQCLKVLIESKYKVGSDEFTSILDTHNEHYKNWLKKFCITENLKHTQPLIKGFENHMVDVISRILKPTTKTETNADTDNKEVQDNPVSESPNS